ncbi:MAG TPA: outer membrane beta-barrel protein [Nitrospira sp.]|nr:outer membrane beta-barrel protein [Nitrospira sp.]
MRPRALSSLLPALIVWGLSSPIHAEVREAVHIRAILDLSYGVNANFPDNHTFRSKQTTPQANEVAPNLGFLSIRREVTRESRWGGELGFQAGYDTNGLVPDEREKPLAGSDILRHLAQANVTYLAPLGKGLAISAGLMKGFINFESFYAVNNFNYTRAYLTDYSPNFIFGVGSRYPITENVDVGFHVLNGFQHLAHPNGLPSYGAELDWRIARRWVVAQNVYYGPDQEDTSIRYWRIFSDTQLQWRGEDWTVVAAFDIGTERIAEQISAPRSFWTGAALFTRWEVGGPWSLAVRPEFFWDRNGRLTRAEQLIWAVTSTLEYKRNWGDHTGIVRLEHRFDRSTGVDGGFFRGSLTGTGQPALVPNQHLILLSLLWAFDS